MQRRTRERLRTVGRVSAFASAGLLSLSLSFSPITDYLSHSGPRKDIPKASVKGAIPGASFEVYKSISDNNRTGQTSIPELESTGKRYAVIINGDDEERHKENVKTAIDSLGSRGFDDKNIFVAGEFVGEKESNRYEATKKGLADLFSSLSERLEPGDKVIVYVTGHGGKTSIALKSKEMTHDDFLDMLEPLKKHDNVYIFDHCYSGSLPNLLVDNGFKGVAMAPVVEGRESHCQLFIPYFWGAVKTGVDANGNEKSSIEEIFAYSINIYNKQRSRFGLNETIGSYRMSLQEPESLEEIKTGNVLLDFGAEWCGACKELKPNLDMLRTFSGDELSIYYIDHENPLKNEIEKAYGKQINAYPTMMYLKDGRLLGIEAGYKKLDELKLSSHKHYGKIFINEQLTASLEKDLVSNNEKIVLEALRKINEFDAKIDVNKLEKHLNTKNPQLRSAILRAVSNRIDSDLESYPKSIQEFIKKLFEEEKGVYRVIAAGILARNGDAEALDCISKNLSQSDGRGYGSAAAEAFEKLGKEGVPRLIHILKTSEYFSTRVMTVMALGQIGDERAVSVLADVLENDETMRVRFEALDALAKIGNEESIYALLKYCSFSWGDNHYLHSQAWKTVGRIGEPTVPIIKEALTKDEYEVRGLLYALGEIGGKDAADILLTYLGDEEHGRDASSGLFRIGDAYVASELTKKVGHKDVFVREMAVRSLEKMARWKGNKDVVPGLIKALKDKDESIRHLAAIGLGEAEDERAIPALKKALRDKVIREEVEGALICIEKPSTTELIEELKGKSYYKRHASSKVLAGRGGDKVVSMLIDAMKKELNNREEDDMNQHLFLFDCAHILAEIGDERALPVVREIIDLRGAAHSGSIDLVEFLVKSEEDIDATNEEGCTALMLAAKRDEFWVIKILLENGADVNIKDNEGKTALDYASEHGDTSSKNILIRYETTE